MTDNRNEYENVLAIEGENFELLKEIVDNLPHDSFIMPEESSLYEGPANAMFDDKDLIIEPLLNWQDEEGIDPSCSLVIKAEVFHARAVVGKYAHTDLVLTCLSVENNWELRLKLIGGKGSDSELFLKKDEEGLQEVEITSSSAELFVKINDILLQKVRKSYKEFRKAANLSEN